MEKDQFKLKFKYVSKRRERKWENANMILMQCILYERHIDISNISQAEYEMDISGFRPFFSLHDAVDREEFLTYKYQPMSNPSRRTIRLDDWILEENAWISKVKKQVRLRVIKIFKENKDMIEFLKAIELILSVYVDTKTALSKDDFPTEFSNLFELAKNIDITDNVLIIPIKDLPLHRLVTLAACLFYGLHYKTEKNCYDSNKVMKIWLPKNESSITSCDASLLSYLLMKVYNIDTCYDLDQFICPITNKMFIDPVITKYGHMFERDAILNWIEQSGYCPITAGSLHDTDLCCPDPEFLIGLQSFRLKYSET